MFRKLEGKTAQLGWLVGAAAFVVLLGGLLRTPRFDPATATRDNLKTVRISIYGRRGPLQAGDVVRPDDPIQITFNNPRLEATRLLVYAIDAAGETHWWVPRPRSDGRRDGIDKGLPTTTGEHVLLAPVALGDLPAGPLTFVALVNPGVIQLDRIDAFTPEGRSPEGLREAFPDGVVLSWPVEVAPPLVTP